MEKRWTRDHLCNTHYYVPQRITTASTWGTHSPKRKVHTVQQVETEEEGVYALWHRVSITEYGLCITEARSCFGRITSILLFTGTKFINMNIHDWEPATLIDFFKVMLNPKSDFANCYLDHFCWYQTNWMIHNNGTNLTLKRQVTPCSCLITMK